MTNQEPKEAREPADNAGSKPPKRKRRGAAVSAIAAIALLGVGAVAGAGAMRLATGPAAQALIPPTPINALKDDSVAAVKGKVAEIFGNKFVVEDPTGRTLIETGPQGAERKLVAQDETVTVQGRYDDGFMHGSMIIHADGRTNALSPMGGPPPPPGGPRAWMRKL